VPGSFILVSLRSCCLRPRSLMPFLHSGPFKFLFSSVRPFRVLGAMSFPCLCNPCSLPGATFAPRVVLIPAAANSLHGPQFSWVLIFLMRFLFRHATVAQLDTFLQAAANFLRDPQSPRVSSFGSPRRPAADLLPLCRFFRPLTGFTTASSLKVTWCSATDCIIPLWGSAFSVSASVVS
jgi:hypothetical protein